MSDSGNQKLAFLVVCSQEAITAQVILEHMGARSEAYGCEICSSTDEALEHKELSNFDVVFVDQSALHLSPDTVQNPHLMQNESFLQLCQTLPVVVVCRSDAELLAARLLSLGAMECIFADPGSNETKLTDHFGRIAALATGRWVLQLDLHTAKQTARELESLRQLFLGRLHEEFRGPLGSVIGAATLLYEKLSDPQAREEAEHIQEQALSIQSLLSDMVVIAQNCGKHLPVSQVRFNLRQEIIRVFSTVALEARERNITFFCNVAGTLDRSIYANKVGLSHVFAVLLGHLVRAIPTDYVISVSCHPIQSAKADCIDFECKLAVSSGDPAVKVVPQRLGFDTRTIGEGAGLSIKNSPYMAVSHILDSLNGVLEVSTSADRGVSFRVFVPELSLVEHLDLVEEEEDDSEKLTSLRVLVVDDDRTIQMVLSRFLERRGHQVVVAENGIEAIREFRQGSFDLVFMDIRMPECDGYEATDSIRAIERQLGWRRVPIYGISAHVDMDAAGKWKQFGMDGAFVKPVGLQVLESLLIEIVAERNARLGMVVNDELEENESYES